jgi:hypothetical protein
VARDAQRRTGRVGHRRRPRHPVRRPGAPLHERRHARAGPARGHRARTRRGRRGARLDRHRPWDRLHLLARRGLRRRPGASDPAVAHRRRRRRRAGCGRCRCRRRW